MQHSRLELLQSMPIFGGLEAKTLEFLLDESEQTQFPAGHYFFHEGDDAHSMFVLESGAVEMSRNWQGHHYPLRKLKQGDCFGEMALMDFSRRSASVQAVEDCRCIEISTQALYKISKSYPQQYTLIQMNMGREICRRLRETEDRLFQNLASGKPNTKIQIYHVI